MKKKIKLNRNIKNKMTKLLNLKVKLKILI